MTTHNTEQYDNDYIEWSGVTPHIARQIEYKDGEAHYTTAPDGKYDMSYEYNRIERVIPNAVVVKNGVFIDETTLFEAAIELRDACGYHGTYLDSIIMRKDTNVFQIDIGS